MREPDVEAGAQMLSLIRFVFTTALLFGAVLMIAVSGTRIVEFFMSIDEFSVKGLHLVCEQPLNNRCVMHYVIDRPGKGIADFVPFGTQFESYPLERGLSFKKSRYGFSYELNHHHERWVALWNQLGAVGLGCLGLLLWYAIGGIKVARSWLSQIPRKGDG